MMVSNKEKIISYIRKQGQATAAELLDVLDIERAMIHRHLKRLVEAGILRKIGSAPKVWYVPAETGVSVVADAAAAYDTSDDLIEKNFLMVTPSGERLEGRHGFAKWCTDRRYDVARKASEYIALHKKYAALRKNGLLDGVAKMRETFGDDCQMDKVYYIDFYAWEIFGKTRLGQLLLYAKQSQDKKMMREVAEIVRPHVNRLIARHHVEAVGYIPPTVKRTVQLMSVLEKSIHVTVPEIRLEKVVGEVRVPQKTLSKLADRVQNARATVFVAERRSFGTVLLIDDAVGSGATFNEVARKLKSQGVAKRVICLAITGSLKGFDVISEV
jgi:phosphoribosylpyrophosphate synthetase